MQPLVLIADAGQLQDEALYRYWAETAPESRREKLERIHFPSDRRLSLAAWAVLLTALGRSGLDASKLTLCTAEHGKPYFREAEGFFFNLSHSGSSAVCCVSDTETGCDCELIRERGKGIAERFFHQAEVMRLAAIEDEAHRTEEFTRIWTLKESYMKCTGKGFCMPMNSFGILFDGDDRPYLPGEKFFFSEFAPGDGLRYSCCVKDNAQAASFEHADLTQI